MGRLFWKIFIWFWLASVTVFVVTAWSTGQLVRSLHTVNAQEQLELEALAVEARLVLLQRGPRALRHWLRTTNESPETKRMLRILRNDGRPIGGPPLPGPQAQLIRRSLETMRDGGESPVPIFSLNDRDPHPLFLVATPRLVERGPGGRDLRHRYPEFAVVRLLIALGISALGCFLLARHLTRPIASMRAVTQAVARGELDTRVPAELAARRDELGMLARDFDSMAQRVQALLDSHRQLLRDVSHELRSPLARLQVALGITRQRAGAEHANELQRIEHECEQLEALIAELLSLARLDTLESLNEAEPVDLIALVGDVAEDARFEAGESDREIRFAPQISAQIEANPALLHRAVENVVRNALRHTPAGGVVQISVMKDESGDLLVLVQDEGPGLDPADLKRIFEPFVRAGQARDRDSGGHGIGLAIAARVAHLHGGSIRAENRPEGGLEVALRLPA